jgi:hypothetical protein
MLAPNPNFFLKIKNYLPFASAGLLSFRTESPVQGKKTGSRNRSKAVRETGLGLEPVGPAGFAGSGPVLVTLVPTQNRQPHLGRATTSRHDSTDHRRQQKKTHRLHSKSILSSCFLYQSSLSLYCHLVFFINPV